MYQRKHWQIPRLLFLAVVLPLLFFLALAIGPPFCGFATAIAEPADPGQADAGQDEAAPDTVAVTDIELNDYKDRMIVGDTQDLSATVLPVDASDQTISFSSSDSGIITVSSRGQLKAVGAGAATVLIRADGVTKEISIEVRNKTSAIKVNVSFLVLAPGEAFTLKTSVSPDNAPQSVSYKSLDKAVADVTESGTILARETGVTSVIVTNGDMSAAVTVLVNQRTAFGASNTGSADSTVGQNAAAAGVAATEAAMIGRIEAGEGIIRVRQHDLPLVTSNILKALYAERSTLIVECPAYTLTIVGERIVNEQNELLTSISFQNNADSVEFVLNQGDRLPGEIDVELTDATLDRQLLYLFNSDKGSYQELDSKAGTMLRLDEPGTYKLTDKRLNSLTISPLWLATAGLIILVGVVVFIIFRRRYWFW